MPVYRKLALLVAPLVLIGSTMTTANAAPQTLNPSDDTFVNENYATSQFGKKRELKVDGNPNKIAYLKFVVPDAGSATGATLAVTGVGAQETVSIDVHQVSTAWNEETTWNTRPELGARIGSVTVGNGVQGSLAVPIAGDHTAYALVRTTHGPDTVLASSEHPDASARPTLTVTYGGEPAPAPAPEPEPEPAPEPEPEPAPEPEPEPDPISPPPSDGDPFIAYTADSFFREPLPRSGVPVASDSDRGIAFAKNHPEEKFNFPTIRGVGGNKWGMVFGKGTCSDPIWKIGTGNVPSQWVDQLRNKGFHAPANFGNFTGTSDSPFVVIDTCTGISIWGAKASAGSGERVINVGVVGAFEHNSNGLDRRNPQSNSARNERSRGAIPDAMVIRDELLEAALNGANGGTLGHTLHMFFVETDTAAGHVHPMIGEESGKAGYGAEGQRIRVKESWTPPPGANPVGVVIARTLQRYGAYLGDNSGSGSALKAEQGSTFPGLTATVLEGVVTWDDFEFIAPGYQP